MRRNTLLFALVVATWLTIFAGIALAQPPEQAVIALSPEDAETCKAGGCALITQAARDKVGELVRHMELLEKLAARQAEELKATKNPKRTYCI